MFISTPDYLKPADNDFLVLDSKQKYKQAFVISIIESRIAKKIRVDYFRKLSYEWFLYL
jgi:hypothetical protein